MRFDCGPSEKEKADAKSQWHQWFAWRPVEVGDRDCRWLEIVWRKASGLDFDYYRTVWIYEYKPFEENPYAANNETD